MSHEYFRSYLKNILNEYTGRCINRCNEIQTSEHLLIKCIHYREEIEEMKKHLLIINITVLFNTKKGLDLLIKYFKFIKIETRKWILELTEKEVENTKEWEEIKQEND